jgi:hypothetical protein
MTFFLVPSYKDTVSFLYAKTQEELFQAVDYAGDDQNVAAPPLGGMEISLLPCAYAHGYKGFGAMRLFVLRSHRIHQGRHTV